MALYMNLIIYYYSLKNTSCFTCIFSLDLAKHGPEYLVRRELKVLEGVDVGLREAQAMSSKLVVAQEEEKNAQRK